jgi:hypothetical protein
MRACAIFCELGVLRNINKEVLMAKFGRFEFGKEEPTETYEGDRMQLEKGYVKVMRGEPNLIDLDAEELVAVIHLDKGQSVRELETK